MPESSESQRVFGMDARTGRWVFVILGLVINLCCGSIYAWSVFAKPLEQLFHVGATESLLPFIIFLATFAVVMPFAGRPLDRYGPRLLTIIGGIIIGIGWILGSMATSMGMLSITYGIIGGAGVGIVYNCPIGVAGRWFPDRRGLAVGATVLGFGLSPLITAPLARQWIQVFGPLTTFGYFGGIFLVLIVLLALPLRFPPDGWKPKGWEPGRAGIVKAQDLSRNEMVRTRSFWGLWICYVIGTLAGLMAIGISSSVGQEVFLLSAATAASFTGIFAIFNGIGRPIFGHFVDRSGPQRTAMLSFLIIFLAAGILALGAGTGLTAVYVIGFAALWLCLGGWLAIAPACTASFCGTKHYGPNYGLVFTAYGVGAILGNLLAGRLRDILGSYTAVFMPVAILAIAGILIAYFTLKPPE
ncbi:MAG: OFA family MFS transporter [Methanomicrobiales archaeon]|nr:OFA family MFS transporter [Methanomicrobiales archaeon]